jgi:hypothetical protein
VQPQPAEDDLDLDREIEYAFDTDEPMLGRPPAGDVEYLRTLHTKRGAGP